MYLQPLPGRSATWLLAAAIASSAGCLLVEDVIDGGIDGGSPDAGRADAGADAGLETIDESRTPCDPVPFERGWVSIEQNGQRSDGGATVEAGFGYYHRLNTNQCTQTCDGECLWTDCRGDGGRVFDGGFVGFAVGSLYVANDRRNLRLRVPLVQDGYSAAWPRLFEDGEPGRVYATMGAEFYFIRGFVWPPRPKVRGVECDGGVCLTVATSDELQLRWSDAGLGYIGFSFERNVAGGRGEQLLCYFPTSRGNAAVPARLLSQLRGDAGTFSLRSFRRYGFDAGPWPSELHVTERLLQGTLEVR